MSEGVRAGTLQWWSWRLENDTPCCARASGRDCDRNRGARDEPSNECDHRSRGGDAIVRCDVEADVEYVASLLRALRKS